MEVEVQQYRNQQSMALSVEEYVSKTLTLLEKEREAEIEEARILKENVSPKELQRRGVCLLKLHVSSRHTGMYGRTILVFQSSAADKELPTHNFSPGDIVGLSVSQADSRVAMLGSGVVSRVASKSIDVAFEENMDLDEDAQFKLVKLANEVTYKRLKSALIHLDQYRTGSASQLIAVMFGQSAVGAPYTDSRKQTDFINKNLDESQQEAVRFALSQREVAVIHGPPGTGKTTTVVEIISQAVRQGLKVLACAPSNIAVDNLVERLALQKHRLVRLGHPARLLPGIQRHSLDAILSASEETKLVEDVRKDMDRTLAQMRKVKNNKGERQRLREDLKHYRKELRQRETMATESILKKAEIVLSTLTSATNDGPIKHLDQQHFDVVVIDECSQAVEAACWIALLKGSKCILSGDHKQLPPTILSHEAAKEGLELTLMERVLNLHGNAVMRMLSTQYRMNELIMTWSSQQLYEGKLVAHESVATHLLRDLSNVDDNDITSLPLLLIDTAGCDLYELETPEEVSKGNEGEADLVSCHVKSLVDSGLRAEDIAVIAPYNLQVDLLRLRLAATYPKLEIKSVDGFQGREKEAVVISLVRSNKRGEVGFLAEDRRINVAITRARRHLVVVCDTDTVGHHPFLKSLVDYMSTNGELRSAVEYQQDGCIGEHHAVPNHVKDGMLRVRVTKTRGEKQRQGRKQNRHDEKTKQFRPGEQKLNDLEKEKHQEAENETRRLHFEKQVEDFVHDVNMSILEFPSNLNSFERRLVHEIAESMGLAHISEGDGTDRHIVLRKKDVNKSATPKTENSQQIDHVIGAMQKKVNIDVSSVDLKGQGQNKGQGQQKHQGHSENKGQRDASSLNPEIQEKDKLKTDKINTSAAEECGLESKTGVEQTDPHCENCGKTMPQQNLELHILRCKKLENLQTSAKSKVNDVAKKTRSKKKSAKNKPDSAEVEDDFDTLIASALEMNSKCNHPKCKTNVLTLGLNCQFCAKRFCLSHNIPEVHGCGSAAKTHARQMIVREGVLYSGSGVPEKKPDPTKKAFLQRKLDRKLEEMNEKRKTKKKGDK